MKISIVIPAYNEQHRLERTLRQASEYFLGQDYKSEILVVDDGSTDETGSLVTNLATELPSLKLITLSTNKGKGFAVKTGVLAAEGDYILFCDADGSTPIVEIEKLCTAMDREGAALAIGSRAISSPDSVVEAKVMRKFIGRIFNHLANLIAVPGISDTQCGFKLFKREAARQIFSKQHFPGFSFDIEILRIAQKSELKIVEVPINWHHVTGSKVDVIRDGLRMLRDTIKIAWIHR